MSTQLQTIASFTSSPGLCLVQFCLVQYNFMVLKGSNSDSMWNVYSNLFFFTPIPKFIGLRKSTFFFLFSSLLRVKDQPTCSSIPSVMVIVHFKMVHFPNSILCPDSTPCREEKEPGPQLNISSVSLEAIWKFVGLYWTFVVFWKDKSDRTFGFQT